MPYRQTLFSTRLSMTHTIFTPKSKFQINRHVSIEMINRVTSCTQIIFAYRFYFSNLIFFYILFRPEPQVQFLHTDNFAI